MIYHSNRQSKTLAGGAVSYNTESYFGSELKHVIVTPTTSTNVYDFSLTNAAGDKIFERIGIAGNINEVDLNTPFQGVVTVAIANATVTTDPVTINLITLDSMLGGG